MKDNYTTPDISKATDLLTYPDKSLICFIDEKGKMDYKHDNFVVIEPIYDYSC